MAGTSWKTFRRRCSAPSPNWCRTRPQSIPKLAVVMDVRSKGLFADMRAALGALEASGVTFRVLFLDANDDVLVRRFEQGRRPHPLQGGGRILDGIAAEREVLQELRDTADIVLDTSDFNVHGLATAITELFSETGPGGPPAERDELRLQVRPARGRQLRRGRPLHPQPALGARSCGRTQAWTRTSAITSLRPRA